MIVYLTNNGPVYHIIRFQNRYTHKVEFGTNHIVFIPYPDNVRIGIVTIQNRIGKRSVSQISPTRIYIPATGASQILPATKQSHITAIGICP